jgi:hypothetical protein
VCLDTKTTRTCKGIAPLPLTSACGDPCRNSLDFTEINFGNIDSVLEFSHIGGFGLDLSTPAVIYTHVADPNNPGNAQWTSKLTANNATAFNNASVSVSFSPADGTLLPPSAGISFIQQRENIPVVVIGDFKDSFTTPFFNSDIDDGMCFA